jgi:hypothetical protein
MRSLPHWIWHKIKWAIYTNTTKVIHIYKVIAYLNLCFAVLVLAVHLPVQVAGARQVRRCVCSVHRPLPQMQIHAPAARVTPLPTSVKILQVATVSEFSPNQPSFPIFSWRGAPEWVSALLYLAGS